MNKRQIAHRTRLNNVIGFFETYPQPLSRMTALAKYRDQVKELVAHLQKAEGQQNDLVVGAVEDRDASRDQLERAILHHAAALYNFAHNKNDFDLKELMDTRPSHLDKLTDEEIAIRARTVLSKVTPYVGQLDEFDVTNESIAAFSATLADFEKKNTIVDSTEDQSVGITASIPSLIDKASDLVDMMGRLMDSYQDQDPELYHTWLAAKKIGNPYRTKNENLADEADENNE